MFEGDAVAHVAKLLEEHGSVDQDMRCLAPGCSWTYPPDADDDLPRLIAEHQAAVLSAAGATSTVEAAGAVAELELLRAGAAAGLDVVYSIWGGGRSSIRLGELMRMAREFGDGEIDGLLKAHHAEHKAAPGNRNPGAAS